MVTPDTPEPEPLYERFTVTHASDMVLTLFYCGGVTLREAQLAHPLAKVKTIGDSQVEPSGA